MPGSGPDILKELKIALGALELPEVTLCQALPATPYHRPASLHGLDLETLATPAKYARKVFEPPRYHLYRFVIDLPAHIVSSSLEFDQYSQCLAGQYCPSSTNSSPPTA
jgi:hypothetical protein